MTSVPKRIGNMPCGAGRLFCCKSADLQGWPEDTHSGTVLVFFLAVPVEVSFPRGLTRCRLPCQLYQVFCNDIVSRLCNEACHGFESVPLVFLFHQPI